MKNRILFVYVCVVFIKTQSGFLWKNMRFCFCRLRVTRFGKPATRAPKKCGEKKSGGENSEHFHSISLFDAVDSP